MNRSLMRTFVHIFLTLKLAPPLDRIDPLNCTLFFFFLNLKGNHSFTRASSDIFDCGKRTACGCINYSCNSPHRHQRTLKITNYMLGLRFRTEDCAHLIILEPGQALSRQHEPVLLSSSFHDADVVDGQPSFANDLMNGERSKVKSSDR